MKYELAQTNRLGNRSSNQDRTGIARSERAVLLALADGMGGHAGGALAAQLLVDTLVQHFEGAAKPIANPQAFFERSIVDAHCRVIAAGQQRTPPISPRTTCVACLVQDGTAWWAHAGDSRLYLIRQDRVLARTRDHTFVEQLYQGGVISKQERGSHPMRNYITQCVGGDSAPPQITFGPPTPLEFGDVLLLCSDGLWAALSSKEIIRLLAQDIPLADATEKMASCAEIAAYPASDNVSIAALRWLGNAAPREPVPRQGEGAAQTPSESGAKDRLSSAIEEITRAIEQYEKEMKR